jgi:hypothetical protein
MDFAVFALFSFLIVPTFLFPQLVIEPVCVFNDEWSTSRRRWIRNVNWMTARETRKVVLDFRVLCLSCPFRFAFLSQKGKQIKMFN